MKKILLCVLAFLLVSTASIGGVLLAQNSAGGGIDNSVSESVTTTADAPTYTDYYWTDEGNYATSFAGGSGTESDPYLISTAAQLAYLAYRVNFNSQTYSDTYFKQTADIDLSAYYWDAIGNSSSIYFAGHYDGGGYTISGLFTQAGSSSTYNYQGLFGYVYGTSSSNLATISDVGIVESNIQGYRFVGAIAGRVQYTTISNCYNTGSVTGRSYYVGGVVGYNRYGYVYNSYNTGSVSGYSYVGGVVGYNYGFTSSPSYVYNCYNTGSVTSTTAVSTYSSYVGGVVGYSDYCYSYVYNCYNTGSVTGSSYVGGVVGYSYSYSSSYRSYVYNCYNTGSVSGSYYVGGVVGNNTYSSSVYNSYNTGSVTGSGSYVGGVVGYNNSYSSYYAYVYNCYNTGSVTSSSSYVGGVVGYNRSSYIYNSYNTGSVTGSDEYVGGVVGFNYSSSYVYNCYFGGSASNSLSGIGSNSGTSSNVSYYTTLSTDAKSTSWYSTSSSTWNSSYPWDFSTVWIIVSSVNDGYPVFIWQVTYNDQYYYRTSSDVTYATSSRIYGENFTTLTLSDLSGYYNSNGWSLAGWATSSSSTSATYSAGAEVSDYNSSTDTLSFYAIASRTIQITYNANAGSDAVSNLPSSQSATQNWNMYGGTTSTYITNYSLTISSTQPTRTGYTFQGWATSSTGTASYASGATVSFAYNSSASVTLYAVWIQNTAYYYRDSSGDLTSTTQERTYGSSFTTLSSVSGIYSSNGWSLIGWSTSSSSTSITSNYYSTNTPVSAYNSSTSQVVLYAIASRTIQITYNANAGSDAVSGMPNTTSTTQYWNMYGTSSSYYSTYSLTVDSTQPTRTGYTFQGWSTDSSASAADSSYAGGTTVNFGYNTSNSITLYAVWEPNVPAYYDNENGYWYIEYGSVPQTKVTDSTTITALGSATTEGGTYYFAGESYTAVVYNDNEYCYILGNWYLVEPIRWIIYSAGELTSGNVVQVSTAGFDYYMVTASVVDVGAFADSYVRLESGYSTTNSYVTNFQENISGYLGEFNADVQTFGTSGTTSSSTSAYIFLSSAKEIQNALGTMAASFSDLVLDYLSSVGSYYFTRDLGTNLNNVYVYSRAGSQTQKLATSVYGMRFTVKFTEFVCL